MRGHHLLEHDLALLRLPEAPPPPPTTRLPSGQVAVAVFSASESVCELPSLRSSPGSANAGAAEASTAASAASSIAATRRHRSRGRGSSGVLVVVNMVPSFRGPIPVSVGMTPGAPGRLVTWRA
jgi:hypothetical protein